MAKVRVREDPGFEQRPAEGSRRRAGSGFLLFAAASLVLSGCGIFEPFDPIAELEVDGSVALSADGDTVLYTLTVRNPTKRDIILTDGSGLRGVGLEVHAVPAEGGGLLWDWRRWPRNIGNPTTWPVPGGGTVTEFGLRGIPVSRILGDSISPGRYEVRVRPNFEQRVPEDRLVPVELLLGG